MVRCVGARSQCADRPCGGPRIRSGGGNIGEGAPGGPLGHHQTPRTLQHHIEHWRDRWCVDPAQPQRAPQHRVRAFRFGSATYAAGLCRGGWCRPVGGCDRWGCVDDGECHITLDHGVIGMPEPQQSGPTVLVEQPVPARRHRRARHTMMCPGYRTPRRGRIIHSGRLDYDALLWGCPVSPRHPLLDRATRLLPRIRTTPAIPIQQNSQVLGTEPAPKSNDQNDGVQTHRVRSAPLARRERPTPGRPGTRRREVRQRQAHRAPRRIRR